MALHIDDIIHSAGDLVVSFFISPSSVSAEVEAGVRSVVDIQEFLVVAVDGAGHSRPRPSHAEMTRYVGSFKFSTLQCPVLRLNFSHGAMECVCVIYKSLLQPRTPKQLEFTRGPDNVGTYWY